MKQEYTIPSPATGVRKDIDPLVADQSMAISGQNAIHFDAALRPRPALDVAIENYIDLGNWQLAADAADVKSGLSLTGSTTIDSIYEPNDGSYMLAAVRHSSSVMGYSLDGGGSWKLSDIPHPDTNYIIKYLGVHNGYLIACGIRVSGFPAVYSHKIWRMSAANLPLADGAWTELVDNTDSVSLYGKVFSYDESEDAFAILGVRRDVSGNPWNEYSFKAIVIYDATGVTPSSDEVLSATDYGYNGLTFSSSQRPVLTSDGYLMVPFWKIAESWKGINPPLDTGSGVMAVSVTYVAGVLTWEANSTAYIWLWRDYRDEGGLLYNYLDIDSVVTDAAGQTLSSIIDIGDGFFTGIYIAGSKTEDYEDQFIARFSFSGGAFDQDSLEKVKTFSSSVQLDVKDAGRTTEKIIYAYSEYNTSKLPLLLVSSDAGKTFQEFPAGPDVGDSISSDFFYFNDTTDRHYYIILITDFPDADPYIYMMPTSAGGGANGAVTSIVEYDMDNEENALFSGTTTALLRLNKDTGKWERITANQNEFIDGSDGDAPGGPYTPDGVYDWDEDIPPLSVASDDPEYVSGVTIDAVYGQNPWVFRSFESGAKTYLIATNGQCYPLIYHSDMNGGFARRLGEVPDNDPNYRVMQQLETDRGWLANGNLAPRGRCMAVAANRVILANNPTGSPFEVNVGGINDPDRGWGTAESQLVLLGDTQGEIVTMEEISALQVAVYKEDAIYHALAQTEFLGVAAPFRFELSKAGVSGPCSPASVLRNFDGRHIFLARDGGVYMYDGVAPIDGGRNIRRLIQNEIDLNQLGKVWGMVDRQRKLVWFFYPSRDALVNKGIVISTDQGYPWQCWPVRLPTGWNFTCGAEVTLSEDASISDLAEFGSYNEETLSSFSHGQTAMITGRESGTFYAQKWQEDENGYTDSGLPIKFSASTGWLTPGGLRIHTADDLHHIFSSHDPAQEIRVRLRAQKIGRSIQQSAWRTLTADKARRRTRHRVSGVQFGVDLQADVEHNFSWAGAILRASTGGRYRG